MKFFFFLQNDEKRGEVRVKSTKKRENLVGKYVIQQFFYLKENS